MSWFRVCGKNCRRRKRRSKIEVGIYTRDYENEFISLTDIAKKREGEYPGYVIQNWMRNRSVISFIGLWEALHNQYFNCLEFEAIKKEAGDNGFVMTPKRWIESTGEEILEAISFQEQYFMGELYTL